MFGNEGSISKLKCHFQELIIGSECRTENDLMGRAARQWV